MPSRARVRVCVCVRRAQVTPTTTMSMGSDVGTLFEPMVRPLTRMAGAGFTWYQGEASATH